MNTSSPLMQMHDQINNIAEDMHARGTEAEKSRRISSENIQELAAAGLFRVFQPEKYGGSELSMADVLPLITQTARSCPATSWVMAVLQIHSWMLGLSPDEAQQEVFADKPETLVCGVLQPKGKAVAVEGGFQLSACSWPYASGCDFASWAHLGGLVMQEGGPPEATVFLLPASDYEIVDDWHVTGLRGTGSKSIRTGEVFVPTHRTFKLADAIGGELSSGRSTVYQSAMLPMLCLNVTGPALGAAQTAIELFCDHIENRNLPFSMNKQKEAAQAHQVLGEVMLKVDSAEIMLERGADMVTEFAETAELMPLTERLQVRAYSSGAVRLCVEAIEKLFLSSGGTALQESHPLQQLNRDAKAMAVHAALSHENNLELMGAARLGQPLNSPFV